MASGRNLVSDSVVTEQADTLLIFINDTIPADSVASIDSTQIKVKEKKKDVLEDKVIYSAEDSMIISISGQILYLYGNANVKYTNI